MRPRRSFFPSPPRPIAAGPAQDDLLPGRGEVARRADHARCGRRRTADPAPLAAEARRRCQARAQPVPQPAAETGRGPAAQPPGAIAIGEENAMRKESGMTRLARRPLEPDAQSRQFKPDLACESSFDHGESGMPSRGRQRRGTTDSLRRPRVGMSPQARGVVTCLPAAGCTFPVLQVS